MFFFVVVGYSCTSRPHQIFNSTSLYEHSTVYCALQHCTLADVSETSPRPLQLWPSPGGPLFRCRQLQRLKQHGVSRSFNKIMQYAYSLTTKEAPNRTWIPADSSTQINAASTPRLCWTNSRCNSSTRLNHLNIQHDDDKPERTGWAVKSASLFPSTDSRHRRPSKQYRHERVNLTPGVNLFILDYPTICKPNLHYPQQGCRITQIL